MKRIVVLGLVALWSVGLVRAAAAFTVNGISYKIINGTQDVEVTAGTDKYTGEVVIPSSVTNDDDGTTYTVTAIGNDAFKGCSDLTSVTIPTSVTAIGNTAFSGCSGLTSVEISNSVETIGQYAFDGCSGLTSVTLPDAMTAIKDGTFSRCFGLTSVEIPNSVTSIGKWTFQDCIGLTAITIGNSVETIGQYAFDGCSGLTSVTLPDAMTAIGDNAFYNCSGLTSVAIPTSVTSIGNKAFYNCTGLTSVTMGKLVTSIGTYAFDRCFNLTSVHYTGDIAQWCAISKSSDWISHDYDLYIDGQKVTDLLIPETVTSIGDRAFYYCSGLTSVTIGSAVRTIGQSAFEECSNLTAVTIPDAVTSIGDNAFSACTGLTSVTIGNAVESIGNSAFDGCMRLTSVTIPDAVTSIGGMAFSNCMGLTSVTIGNSVTSIGDYAFSDCRGLTSVTMGNSVREIDNNAFMFCQSLVEIYAYAVEPPALQSNVFDYVETDKVHLYVPQGSVADYQAVETWKDFRIAPFFTVTVSANDESKGTVTGGGIYGEGETARLAATATAGYGFVKWSDGNTDNPRSVTVTSDATFVAEFAKSYTVTVSVNDASMGTVTGGGEFESGATATLTATPNTGCKFVKWRDGETANPRTVTVTSDTTFKAEFAKEIYTVTVSVNDASMGTVTGGGPYESGTTVTLTATPKAGCKFVKWNDGATANPRTVTVTSDTAFEAEFAKEIYTVTVSVNDASMGMVTGGGEFESGATATLTATPKAGHKFVKWRDGETANPRTVTVTSDTTFVADFAKDIYTVTVSSNDESMGSVTGGGEFESGATATLTATPNTGHKFVKWNDGATANPRAVTVTSDSAFVAEFAKEGGSGVATEDLSGRDRIVVMSAQGKIQVQGADGVPVSVYDMSGICLFRGNGRALTEVAVPAPGIYIVKAGAQTAKVMVR